MNEQHGLCQWRGRYASLLTLFPAEFRHDYAPLSLQLFTDILQETYEEAPTKINGVIGSIFMETAANIIREQAKSIVNKFIGNNTSMTSKSHFYSHRNLGLAAATIAVLLIGVLSIYGGFWGYSGPIAYMKRVIQAGITQERIASSTNFNQEEVTAKFVNGFVQSAYYNGNQSNVGYKSIYADQDHTMTSSGGKLQVGLADSIHTKYASMQAGFDPLTCSTQPPTSVRFLPGEYSNDGSTSVVALFTYANSSTPNRVTYDLHLNQSKSRHGNWLVDDVDCTSLDDQITKPYLYSFSTTTQYDRTYSEAVR
jgi:hypothetical protein